ncbi:hypothetical protein BDV12DRAFT_205080 [Aspergillus spectabilis]
MFLSVLLLWITLAPRPKNQSRPAAAGGVKILPQAISLTSDGSDIVEDGEEFLGDSCDGFLVLLFSLDFSKLLPQFFNDIRRAVPKVTVLRPVWTLQDSEVIEQIHRAFFPGCSACPPAYWLLVHLVHEPLIVPVAPLFMTLVPDHERPRIGADRQNPVPLLLARTRTVRDDSSTDNGVENLGAKAADGVRTTKRSASSQGS